MPEITIKGKSLTLFEIAVYLPTVRRAVIDNPSITTDGLKQNLFNAGLVLSDDRVEIMLEYARVRSGLITARVQ